MSINSIATVDSFQVAWIEQTQKWECREGLISRISRLASSALTYIVPGAMGPLTAYASNSFLSQRNWTGLSTTPVLVGLGLLATLVTRCIQQYVWPAATPSPEQALLQQIEQALPLKTPDEVELLLRYLFDQNLPNRPFGWQEKCLSLLQKTIEQDASIPHKEIALKYLLKLDITKLMGGQTDFFDALALALQIEGLEIEQEDRQNILVFLLELEPTNLNLEAKAHLSSALQTVLEDPQIDQITYQKIKGFLFKHNPTNLSLDAQSSNLSGEL